MGVLKWIGWLGLAVAASGAVAYAQAPEMRRATLLVEDLDRSVDFYQRIGMTVQSDQSSRDTDPDGVIAADDLPLTADSTRGRLVVMKGSDERMGLIGLLSYTRPPLANARGNLVGVGTGDFILMIEVPDIGFVYTRLQEAGIRFHRDPYPFEMRGPDGELQERGRRMLAYDPDGHLVEIVERER